MWWEKKEMMLDIMIPSWKMMIIMAVVWERDYLSGLLFWCKCSVFSMPLRVKEISLLTDFSDLQKNVFPDAYHTLWVQVSLVTFITFIYTKEDHYLSPQTAFVAIALFNVLRFAINFAPMIITDVIKVSLM